MTENEIGKSWWGEERIKNKEKRIKNVGTWEGQYVRTCKR